LKLKLICVTLLICSVFGCRQRVESDYMKDTIQGNTRIIKFYYIADIDSIIAVTVERARKEGWILDSTYDNRFVFHKNK